MAYKTKSSPLNQFGSFGRLGGNVGQQSQNMFAGGLSGAIRGTAAQIAAQSAQQVQAGTNTMTNNVAAAAPKAATQYNMVKPGRVRANQATITPAQPNPVIPTAMQPAPINPRAVGNPKTVNGVYGSANANTFTRTVPGNEAPIMQLANPNILQDGPQLPPEAVQTSVTPTLGFENS
jgi:hypothetical protein